jgi:hypothetical protein
MEQRGANTMVLEEAQMRGTCLTMANTMILKKAQHAWYMFDYGGLCGNGKLIVHELMVMGKDVSYPCDADDADKINDGQIVSMEADMDKGTLRFWVDGKQHGPSYMSGVQDRVRWAVGLCYKGAAVEIVPTQELQPWSASWVRPESEGDEE